MISLREVLLLFINHPVFIGIVAGIMGEDYVLFLVILAGAGTFTLWKILLFGFIGIMVHDTTVYLFGRTKYIRHIYKKYFSEGRRKKTKAWIMSFGHGNYIFPMALSKFIYGTRVFATLYAAQHEKKFIKYFLINTGAVVLWFVVMVPIGLFAGKGFTRILSVSGSIQKGLALLVVLMVIYYVINKAIKLLAKRKKV